MNDLANMRMFDPQSTVLQEGIYLESGQNLDEWLTTQVKLLCELPKILLYHEVPLTIGGRWPLGKYSVRRIGFAMSSTNETMTMKKVVCGHTSILSAIGTI